MAVSHIVVMFLDKQATAPEMADQLKNCINQKAHGFAVIAYKLRAQYELLTL